MKGRASLSEMSRYARLARVVGALIATAGRGERSWTRFRIASTIIAEVDSGERWSVDKRRKAAGCHSRDFRENLLGVYEAGLQAELMALDRREKARTQPGLFGY